MLGMEIIKSFFNIEENSSGWLFAERKSVKTLESLPRGESELMPSAAYDAAAPVNVRCLLASLRQSFSAAVL